MILINSGVVCFYCNQYLAYDIENHKFIKCKCQEEKKNGNDKSSKSVKRV